jgi:[ribosomal protein S18]-alanine N-acetyltransferase
MSALPRPDRHAGLHRRAMTVQDLDAVLAIEVQCYSHPWSRGNFIDSLAAGYLAELRIDSAGQLIGYYVAMPGVDEMHLLNLTVAPRHQRRGHARAMLDELRGRALERGDRQLWLEVRQSNEAARALYARVGFAEAGVRRDYYPAAGARREDAIVMSLQLDEGAGDALD